MMWDKWKPKEGRNDVIFEIGKLVEGADKYQGINFYYKNRFIKRIAHAPSFLNEHGKRSGPPEKAVFGIFVDLHKLAIINDTKTDFNETLDKKLGGIKLARLEKELQNRLNAFAKKYYQIDKADCHDDLKPLAQIYDPSQAKQSDSVYLMCEQCHQVSRIDVNVAKMKHKEIDLVKNDGVWTPKRGFNKFHCEDCNLSCKFRTLWSSGVLNAVSGKAVTTIYKDSILVKNRLRFDRVADKAKKVLDTRVKKKMESQQNLMETSSNVASSVSDLELNRRIKADLSLDDNSFDDFAPPGTPIIIPNTETPSSGRSSRASGLKSPDLKNMPEEDFDVPVDESGTEEEMSVARSKPGIINSAILPLPTLETENIDDQSDDEEIQIFDLKITQNKVLLKLPNHTILDHEDWLVSSIFVQVGQDRSKKSSDRFAYQLRIRHSLNKKGRFSDHGPIKVYPENFKLFKAVGKSDDQFYLFLILDFDQDMFKKLFSEKVYDHGSFGNGKDSAKKLEMLISFGNDDFVEQVGVKNLSTLEPHDSLELFLRLRWSAACGLNFDNIHRKYMGL